MSTTINCLNVGNETYQKRLLNVSETSRKLFINVFKTLLKCTFYVNIIQSLKCYYYGNALKTFIFHPNIFQTNVKLHINTFKHYYKNVCFTLLFL